MNRRCLVLTLISAFLVALSATPALAEEVVEAWRSPFATFRSISVNHADGSCWVSSGANVLRLGPDGEVLTRLTGFAEPAAIAVNSNDGSCWAAARSRNEVVHLAADGTELLRVLDLSADFLAVNSTDGSCWAAHVRGYQLVHLAEDGTELWRTEDFSDISAIAVNPTDGSLWLLDWFGIRHLAEDGTELWQAEPDDYSVGWFLSVAVNPTDGSCWVGASDLLHLAKDGTELWRSGPDSGFLWPVSVSVDPTDGSCWVADLHYSDGAIVHVADDGTELLRADGFPHARYISADPTGGSCWLMDDAGYVEGFGAYVGAYEGRSLVHLAEDGTELWRADTWEPGSVSVSPADGSCWAADRSNDQIVRLAEDGTELLRLGGVGKPSGVSVNPVDGSCWEANWAGDVTHRAEDGTELWYGTGFPFPNSLSVNPTDGSCWAAGGRVLSSVTEDGTELWRPVSRAGESTVVASNNLTAAYIWEQGMVVHLAEDGTELWGREEGFVEALSISVNPVDGSCWVSGQFGLVHLAEDGTELLRTGDFGKPSGVSVNPVDGSCWVAAGDLHHLAEDGTVLWRREDFFAKACSVNPVDGSCWVAAGSQLLHLAGDGTELWRGADCGAPAWMSVNPVDGSCWVVDTKNRQLVRLVVVGYQGQPFADVPVYSWAFEEIGDCFTAGIVSGYEDGYHPDLSVSRDQMAVYIARALAGGDDNVPDGPDTATFNDVPTDFWAYKYVEYCVAQDIVQGFDPVTYGPTVTVSRDSMAAFISRAVAGGDANVPDGPAEATFDDVPTDHWAYKYVEYCVANGIVEGYDDDTYGPTGTVSRAQMAVFISRAFDLPM